MDKQSEEIKMNDKVGSRRVLPRSHSPTIQNEVAKTLYTTLAGIVSSLEYDEEKTDSPDLDKLDFYYKIRKALAVEKRKFPDFSDREIQIKTAPLSRLIKQMGNSPKSIRHEILQENLDYITNLLENNKV